MLTYFEVVMILREKDLGLFKIIRYLVSNIVCNIISVIFFPTSKREFDLFIIEEFVYDDAMSLKDEKLYGNIGKSKLKVFSQQHLKFIC